MSCALQGGACHTFKKPPAIAWNVSAACILYLKEVTVLSRKHLPRQTGLHPACWNPANGGQVATEANHACFLVHHTFQIIVWSYLMNFWEATRKSIPFPVPTTTVCEQEPPGHFAQVCATERVTGWLLTINHVFICTISHNSTNRCVRSGEVGRSPRALRLGCPHVRRQWSVRAFWVCTTVQLCTFSNKIVLKSVFPNLGVWFRVYHARLDSWRHNYLPCSGAWLSVSSVICLN